jgi:3-phenylpropionate/trans-cinnamate dioxygenase ferredoxin reductase subunit
MDRGIVIVGASQAGLQVAVTLRQRGHDRPVTLIGAEQHAPYQRPPLSKTFATGTAAPETLALRLPNFYHENGIELITGEEVIGIDRDARSIRTSAGRRIGFEGLALTVGAEPRRLVVPGDDAEGVLYLRDIWDALAMRELLPRTTNVVVVGGGFIGLEAAALAAKAGKKVTLIEATGKLMSRAVGATMSGFFLDAHRRRGVSFRFEAAVTHIETACGRARRVHLADGTSLPAEIVVIGIGAVPRTGLAASAGLALHGQAILVDRLAATSDPRIVAAGDCTVQPHPMDNGTLVRLESVQNAVDQAKVAAATLLGQPEPHRAVPWFWSDQGDLKLQMAGLTTGSDDFAVKGSFESEQFSVSHYRDGALIGVESVNRPADYMQARRALAETLARDATPAAPLRLAEAVSAR